MKEANQGAHCFPCAVASLHVAILGRLSFQIRKKEKGQRKIKGRKGPTRAAIPPVLLHLSISRTHLTERKKIGKREKEGGRKISAIFGSPPFCLVFGQ